VLFIFDYFRSEIIAKENGEQLEAAALPLVIRERDTEYQFHRIVLYDRLIKVNIAVYTGFFFPRRLPVSRHCRRSWYTIFVPLRLLRKNTKSYLSFK
jgi:hypothetical protein